MVASAQGEDRSNFQAGGKPWPGLDFGFAKATEGLTFQDATFEANWASLKTGGKHRGAYHFWHPGLSPAEQASYFVSRVRQFGLADGDILAADVELTAGARGAVIATMPQQAASRSDLISFSTDGQAHVATGALVTGPLTAVSTAVQVREFLDAIKALAPRNPVIIYTNLSIARTLTGCTGYPLWIADPGARAPSSVSPWATWKFWQWEFGGGPGGGDRDAFNGTAEQLQQWINSFHPATPVPAAMQLRIADGHTSMTQMSVKYGHSLLDMIWATVRNTEVPGPAQEAYFGGMLTGHVSPASPMPAGMRIWA